MGNRTKAFRLLDKRGRWEEATRLASGMEWGEEAVD
jgi:hypothetical protein